MVMGYINGACYKNNQITYVLSSESFYFFVDFLKE